MESSEDSWRITPAIEGLRAFWRSQVGEMVERIPYVWCWPQAMGAHQGGARNSLHYRGDVVTMIVCCCTPC